MNAKSQILKLAKERVAIINYLYAAGELSAVERIQEQLTGILICLNKIVSLNEGTYCLNYHDNGLELGCYERGHHWKHLAGVGEKVNV